MGVNRRDLVEVGRAPGFVQKLFKNARTGAQVHLEVMQLGKEIQHLRIANWHTSKSREVMAVVLGELKQSRPGTYGRLRSDTESVKIAVENLNRNVLKVCDTVNARIRTHIQFAEVCSIMAYQVFAVQGNVSSLQQSGMNVDDDICEDAEELCKHLGKLLDKIQAADLEIDVQSIDNLGDKVLASLGYCEMLEENEGKTVCEALKERKRLLDHANETLTKRVECKCRINSLQRKINVCKSTYAQQNEITAEHLRLKAALDKKTLGCHKLHGRAPAGDVRAQEIVRLWNAGEHHLLKQQGSYSIEGVFSYEFDHALTDRQAELRNMIEKATLQADEMKNKHEDDMSRLQKELDVEKGVLPWLTQEAKNASDVYEYVTSPQSNEKHYSLYKAKMPSEYNNMICLYKAYRDVSQAVRWMKTFDGAAQFKRPLELKLKNVQLAASRRNAQACVWFLDETAQYFRMPDESMAALVRTTGVAELQNVMMPESVSDEEIQDYKEAPAVD